MLMLLMTILRQFLLEVIDNHIPMKKKKAINKPAPFMNQTLRREIYKKKMAYNKYQKCKSKTNWENYRKQRNLQNVVTKIKKKSIRNYFMERCVGGPNSKDFWPTIKPFLTDKGLHFNKDIILCEENKIINNQNEVAETFNNLFINVAKDIGSQDIIIDKSHPSIKVIEENKTEIKELCFNAVDSDFVTKYINKINIKKATEKVEFLQKS